MFLLKPGIGMSALSRLKERYKKTPSLIGLTVGLIILLYIVVYIILYQKR
jgi:hypothetical protein